MSSYSSPSLKKVMRSNLCAGCGLCAGVSDGAITMGRDAEGFLRPSQSEHVTETTEKKIEACCPGLRVSRPRNASNYHPVWGAYSEAHVGWSTNEALRKHGSSGAVLSAIAHYLVQSGKVDFILTICDDDEDPISNATYTAKTYEDVYRAAGSRYAPSAPLSQINEFLESGKRFAVIAKPCDISALRTLSRFDRRVNEQVPYLLSFFCAGVPSREGAVQVLEKLSVTEDDLSSFRFRGDGWPGFAKAVRKDGSSSTMSYSDSWGGILSNYVQFRCKVCPDGTGGSADLVCADAWNSDENGYPVFEDEDGKSLVLPRSDVGLALMQEVIAAGSIEIGPFDMSKLIAIQPGQRRRSYALLARLLGLFLKRGARPRFTGFSVFRNARALSPAAFLKTFIGTFRRA